MKRLPKACCAPWYGCAKKKTNAVIDSLKKVSKWRSTRRWQSLHARMMDERRSSKSHKMEAQVGVAQPREYVG